MIVLPVAGTAGGVVGRACSPTCLSTASICAVSVSIQVYEAISGGNDEIDLNGRKVNARAYCSWYNFKSADQQKKVGVLSGGSTSQHMFQLVSVIHLLHQRQQAIIHAQAQLCAHESNVL